MSSAIQYTGDVTLSLRVRDMDAAIQWYRETLGFEVIYKLDEMGWCELSSPAKNVSVGLGQVKEMAPHDGCVPVWGVADIAAARGTLEAKGSVSTATPSRSPTWSSWRPSSTRTATPGCWCRRCRCPGTKTAPPKRGRILVWHSNDRF